MAEITGFTFDPEGALLARKISDQTPHGLAHERAIGYHKDWHSHNCINIILPRGSSELVFRTDSGIEVEIDRLHFGLMAKDVLHKQWAKTSVWDNFALFPQDQVFGAKAVPELAVFPRTKLLDEVVEKLFLSVLQRRPEAEYLNNYLFALDLVFEIISGEQAQLENSSQQVHRAIDYIEAHLFEELDADSLGRRVGLSRSSLYRKFSEVTGQSLMGYVRARRLEEARLLLKFQAYNVSEVAQLVGVGDVYTFSKLFKRTYGISPSEVRHHF